MNKHSSLAKNTLIYAIGNFGSKFLAYVMVLVYSYYITPEELGYYDVVLTTISMIQPLVIFQINDGVFRFLVDSDKYQQTAIVGNVMKFLCITTIASELVFAIFCGFVNVQYAVWIGLLLVTTMFFVLMQDIIRGLGLNKEYAAYGVLNSVVMLVLEAVGLIALHMGVEALLISKVCAYGACIITMFARHRELSQALREKISKKVLGPILKYSAPLVPNTICWWVVNSSDRYIILFALGAAYNGIYSMSTKFPTILTMVTSIFYLAWQETAIKEYNTPERDRFFSDIFQKYYVLLFSLCLCAIPATRIVIELFVSDAFKDAWKYTGFLYLGASFSALCSFLGMGYQISKETARSLATTIFAAILNFGVNIACVEFIGLQAASFSTFAAYLFLLIIRLRHSKRYFTLTICWKQFIILFVASLLFMTLTFVVPNLWLCAAMTGIAVIILVKCNYEIIAPYMQKVIKR